MSEDGKGSAERERLAGAVNGALGFLGEVCRGVWSTLRCGCWVVVAYIAFGLLMYILSSLFHHPR